MGRPPMVFPAAPAVAPLLQGSSEPLVHMDSATSGPEGRGFLLPPAIRMESPLVWVKRVMND